MDREEMLPTEREWLIMDAVWDSDDQPTSSEIFSRIDEASKLDARTERVLLHHLCRKGLLGYIVDEHDSRVYHYYPLRTREECQREKSRDFIDTYFHGSSSVAVAALLKNAAFTDEQLKELEEILKSRKDGEKA